MQMLRSIIFTLILWIESLAVWIIMAPVMLLPRKTALLLPIVWTKVVRMSMHFVGITVKVEGLKNLPKKQGYIVASKHQSAMETLLFHALVPNTFYILKKSLMWLPFAGIYAWRTGCIPIDRQGGAKTMRLMLNKAHKRLTEGMNLIIFPEGTRTAPGEKTNYHPGIAFLYEQCKVPVVPVALNTGVFWPKNKTLKHPGTVIIRFLPPIQPGLEKRTFLTRLENTIEQEQKKLPLTYKKS